MHPYKKHNNCTTSCYDSVHKKMYDETIQNQIWKVTRIPASLYTSKLMNASCGLPIIPENNALNWNQSSDRRFPGQQTRYVSRRETRCRPGGMGPSGTLAKGVDIKHNSYARYLGQLKSYRCKDGK